MGSARAKGKASKVKESVGQKPTSHLESTNAIGSTTMPFEFQQLLLNIFKNALPVPPGKELTSLIQEVKQHLYCRDFAKAFGHDDYLRAYALRWSSSRSLAYLNIFCHLPEVSQRLQRQTRADDALPAELQSSPSERDGLHSADGDDIPIDPSLEREQLCQEGRERFVCIGGGGGAELVALAGLLLHFNSNSLGEDTAESISSPKISITIIDIADWSSVIDSLLTGINEPPPLSKYASSATRAANKSLLLPGQLAVNFEKFDVLNIADETVCSLLRRATIVTVMFTLNELFSTSIAKTTNFLLFVTDIVNPGTLLLVVDSPGSYSTVALGNDTKKYPMRWLLDHALLEATTTDSGDGQKGVKWQKLISDDSRWFRLDEKLRYPIELEDMRCQIHLYRRL